MIRALQAPVVALLLALSPTALAQPPGDDPVMRSLFPPELVMENQREIGLRPEQREAITDSIRETQGEVLDVQWQLKDAHQHLAELLGARPIDETDALAQAEKVMSLEQEVSIVIDYLIGNGIIEQRHFPGAKDRADATAASH